MHSLVVNAVIACIAKLKFSFHFIALPTPFPVYACYARKRCQSDDAVNGAKFSNIYLFVIFSFYCELITEPQKFISFKFTVWPPVIASTFKYDSDIRELTLRSEVHI